MRRSAPARRQGLVHGGEDLLPEQTTQQSQAPGVPRVSSQARRTAAAMEMCAPPRPQADIVPPITILDWVPRESNTLRGYCTIQVGPWVFHGCSLHQGERNDWVTLTAAPRQPGGRYHKLVEIRGKDYYNAFQAAVLEALRRHPEAGRCWS